MDNNRNGMLHIAHLPHALEHPSIGCILKICIYTACICNFQHHCV